MVHEIKADGHLKLTNIGGMQANNAEAENVRVITKFNGIYEGTCQLANPSVHVNGSYGTTPRTWDVMEVILDEDVKTKADARGPGIMAGDYVCFEPRFRVTEKGYIKSRFLDDKLSSAILMGYARYLMDEKVATKRRIYLHFTIYEEVGHGGCAPVPQGVTEAWSVDMGCVGQGLSCTEHQVSICAKDSGGPYNYDVVKTQIRLAKENGIVLPWIFTPLRLRCGGYLKGRKRYPPRTHRTGVFASHGYERSHVDGVENTFRLIKAYLG